MAWGLWNKIKNGFKKIGGFVKKAAKVVTDKVIKPFKPVITAAATAFNPKIGAAVTAGMNAVEKFSDEGWGNTPSKLDVKNAVSWASNRFK